MQPVTLRQEFHEREIKVFKGQWVLAPKIILLSSPVKHLCFPFHSKVVARDANAWREAAVSRSLGQTSEFPKVLPLGTSHYQGFEWSFSLK
jgi:hypothetical protein